MNNTNIRLKYNKFTDTIERRQSTDEELQKDFQEDLKGKVKKGEKRKKELKAKRLAKKKLYKHHRDNLKERVREASIEKKKKKKSE
jgi:hypothetical protein